MPGADPSAPVPPGAHPAGGHPAEAHPSGASRPSAAPAEHVVLVSFDALRPEFLADPTWPAPTLQQMLPVGAQIRSLRSVTPALTYPAHVTLVTGALPARHGVPYNHPFEDRGRSGRWYWESEHIRIPTLWEAVRRSGGTTANLTWPVTVGADLDWSVPEVWDPSDQDNQLQVLARHARPAGILEELAQAVTGRIPPDAFRGYDLIRADLMGSIAGYLIESRRPTLLLVHLVAADAHQHDEGREGPGVRRAVAACDRAVGRMIEATRRAEIADRTAFVVTGDHGFVDVHTELAPNAWLVEAGVRGPDEDRGEEWRASFHGADGSVFLHLRDPEDEATAGVVRRMIGDLPGRVRALFRVVGREELDRRGAAPEAVLALAGGRGVAFVEDGEGPGVREGSGGAHGHFPDLPEMDAGLVAWGAGVRTGARVDEAELTDVAPLVAALLGLDFEAPDGMLLPALLG